MSANPPSTAAERQAQKRKRILMVLVAATALTWGRALLGGGDDAPAAATTVTAGPTSTTRVAAGAARPAPGAKAAPRGGKAAGIRIAGFDEAMERMEIWPQVLERKTHEGPIEDLVPFDDDWEGSASEEVAMEASLVEAAAPVPAVEPEPEPEPDPLSELRAYEIGLELTSTALFGDSPMAVLSGQVVRLGDTVSVSSGPGAGDYLVVAIRPREVDLERADHRWTLTLDTRGPDA